MKRKAVVVGVLLGSIYVAAVRPAENPDATKPAIGIAAKKPVLGAACKVCPWGVVAEIVRTAMQPYGYDVQICYHCARADAPRIVAGAQMPPPYRGGIPGVILDSDVPPPPRAPVEFGVTSVQNAWWASRKELHEIGGGEILFATRVTK